MLTIADVDSAIAKEFGSLLAGHGFSAIGSRKWVRAEKLPIRELFLVGAIKGGQYAPAWGFSSGLVPISRGYSFRHQSTDKNAVMDLLIDPIDVPGTVPEQAFSFITGLDAEIPIEQIRLCARHFIPLALADFDRVRSVAEFCSLFLERSRLQYRRFPFDAYVQHQLVHGFVLLLNGNGDAGRAMIKAFCHRVGAEYDDPVLTECIRHIGIE